MIMVVEGSGGKTTKIATAVKTNLSPQGDDSSTSKEKKAGNPDCKWQAQSSQQDNSSQSQYRHSSNDYH